MINKNIFRIIGVRGGFGILVNYARKDEIIYAWDRSLYNYLNTNSSLRQNVSMVSKSRDGYIIRKRDIVVQKKINDKITNFIFAVREADIEEGLFDFKDEIEKSERVLFFVSNVLWLHESVRNKFDSEKKIEGCFIYLGGSYCLSHELYVIFPGKLIFVTFSDNINIMEIKNLFIDLEIVSMENFIKKFAFKRIMMNILSLISLKYHKNMGQILNDKNFIFKMEKIGYCLSEVLESIETFSLLKNHFIDDYYEYYPSGYLTKFLRNKEKNDYAYVNKDIYCLTRFLNREEFYPKIESMITEII